MIRGDPIYGRLIGFNLTGEVPMIVVETDGCKQFINLRRVEKIRVADQEIKKPRQELTNPTSKPSS